MFHYEMLRVALFSALIGLALGNLLLSPDLQEAERYVNDTYIVTCYGEGARNTTWKGPSGQVITNNKGRVHVEELRAGQDHRYSLVFESITREDKGNYTCQSVINGEVVKNTFRLIVVKPISFLGPLGEQNATEHQNMLVRCEVTGDPAPSVVWQFKGQSLKGNRYKVMPRGLYISNITHEDVGEYQCKAFQVTTQTSKMAITTINLSVLHKPMWKNNNKSEKDVAYGYLGGIVNLTCEAIALPEAIFTWRRHNVTLNTTEPSHVIIAELHRSVLQFPANNASVFGEYECMASNPLGKIKKTIDLQKGVKPKRPSWVSVQGVGVHTAQFDIQSHSKDDVVIGYRIQFVKQDPKGYSWNSPDYQDVYTKDGPSPFTIIDLKENMDYVARVASRNAAGLSDYTGEYTFRTRDPSTSSGHPQISSPVLIILSVLLLH